MQYFIPLTKKRYAAAALKAEVIKLIAVYSNPPEDDEEAYAPTPDAFNIKKVVPSVKIRRTSFAAAKIIAGKQSKDEKRADYLDRVDVARNVEVPYEKMVMLTQEEKTALFG